jgi:hypothetical protein
MADDDDRMRAQLAEERKRWLYLQHLYDVAQASSEGKRESTPPDLIAYTLGISADERSRIEDYFQKRGLIDFVGFGPRVEITQAGIEAVEEALKRPNQPTSHFSPVTNILNVTGGIHGSLIQQGTSGSRQTMTVRQSDREALDALVREIRAIQVTIQPGEVQEAAIVDLDTVEAQLKSPAPRVSVICECLQSLRAVLEEAGGGVLAAKIAVFLQQAGWL